MTLGEINDIIRLANWTDKAPWLKFWALAVASAKGVSTHVAHPEATFHKVNAGTHLTGLCGRSFGMTNFLLTRSSNSPG
jgi:hypothetical protein